MSGGTYGVEHPAHHASIAPDRPAVVMASDGTVLTYGELDRRSRQVANVLRDAGLRTGDHIAIVLENRVAWFETLWGAMRAGLYVTPINWHLNPDEAMYIVRDCEASAVVASSALDEVLDGIRAIPTSEVGALRLAVGDSVQGFDEWAGAVDAASDGDVPDETEGTWMFYSSGTTGRPKGIKPPIVGGPLGAPTPFSLLMTGLYGFDGDTTYLSPGPLYHAAGAGWTTTVQRLGGTAVVMERFDPLDTLRFVEEYDITHVQFVPTHFVRMLKLNDTDRNRYALSSLRMVVHAAAPCPVEVKRQMLEWLGPIVHEFYSGSEGAGFCAIGPQEWIEHEGSVGRSLMGAVHVLDESGAQLGAGEVGQIWFDSATSFEYHGDPTKTAEVIDERGRATFGDMGMLDEDGYLYLTDRVSNMIISGGVNIYPREVEDRIIGHPSVEDVAVVGVADEEMGESVRAVVQVVDGVDATDELGDEIIEFCREGLSHFKCPRSVVFLDELPRLPTGKLPKRLLPESVLIP